ncbi:MAG TPA: gluconate 2-dehydrogenase subunit 3 family protein [Noviherbaspirillum sp.]|uniref:gluconate 2-dehydrogenase subunit 3 family protein n=1 Tax=Noviherbaspirillum sp. TaxID=1926288 RepID=UPI002B4A35B4|nr:gluconate 2-dehydrogenase subunit 3 family protein [Noviherbaspirillum sp.]HJV85737.1 gluconate 2-dehydrogenase subunit 3 family protein [Noviherbaspirillum sp.]
MFKPARREVLRRMALVGSTTILSSWFAGTKAFAQTNPLLPDTDDPQRYSFFTADELAFINAALDRLIPSDDLGPGARAAGVAWFIDQQMAGPFGRAEHWYMQGPWRQGSEQQGYQLKLTPAQLYRQGIQAVDAYCKAHYGNKTFAQLNANQQEDLLHAIDDGKIQAQEAPLKDFFEMLLQNTHEGYLADPIYGGNRQFAGWKLIGFPGPRYNYVQEITRYGKRYDRPYIGLGGYDGLPALKKNRK